MRELLLIISLSTALEKQLLTKSSIARILQDNRIQIHLTRFKMLMIRKKKRTKITVPQPEGELSKFSIRTRARVVWTT